MIDRRFTVWRDFGDGKSMIIYDGDDLAEATRILLKYPATRLVENAA